MKKRRNRLLSLVLTAAMLLSLLPAVTLPAAAAGEGGDIFEELGFNTDSPPDGYVDDGTNPYGRDKVTMNPVYELFVGSDTSANAYDTSKARTWGLYGNGKEMNAAQLGLSPTASTPNGGDNKHDAYLTAVGDFTGSGKKDIVVALGANTIMDPKHYDSNNPNAVRSDAGLDMFFINPSDGNQSWGENIFPLYRGALGNKYELDTGFLRFDPKKDSNSGGGYYNPILLHNYMQIVTGDFTGDGIDEVAVYIPDHANPRIEVYQLQYQGTGEKQWWLKQYWNVLFTHSIPIDPYYMRGAPNKVSMVAGDLNYDGIDDLAVAYGGSDYDPDGGARAAYSILPDTTNTSTGISGKIEVLFATGGGSGFQPAVSVPYVSPQTEHTAKLINFSLAIGDLTGAGRDRLILAETYDIKTVGNYRLTDDKVAIQSFPYDVAGKKFLSSGFSMEEEAAAISSDSVYPMVRSDAAAVSPGVGQPDQLYYRGFLFRVNGGTGVITRNTSSVYQELADTLKVTNESPKYRAFFEYGITAADLDNDFKEELVLSYNHVVTNNDGPRPYPTRGLVLTQTGKTTGSGLESLRIFAADPATHHSDDFHWPRSCILMATPDTDNDTMLLQYKGQHLTYSDPKILAVMAGAPVYQDLEHLDDGDGYIGESFTTWSSSKGSGGSTTNSKQFNVGAYFGYEHDVTLFGAPLFSMEFEASYSHAITWETEKRSTVTESVEYGAAGYTDAVALYSVPVVAYVFDATIPTGSYGAGTSTQEFTVNIPFSPAVQVVPVDDYERIAADSGGLLPSLRDRQNPVLTHTQGRPETYPTSAAGLQDARVYSGNYASVGFGNGFQSQRIAIETEETSGTSHSDELSFRAGGGAAGFKAGITMGAAFGYGSANISTSGSEFAGSVFNMPAEATDYGYVYSWKLMQYWHTFKDGNKIPVVSYLVETAPGGGTGPLPPPQNLAIDVERSTENSLTLTWDYETGRNVNDFQVYRYNAGTKTYVPLDNGVVSYSAGSGSYSFLNRDLSRGSEYTYKVQARRSSGPPSILSDAVSGWTLASGALKLALSRYELTAYPDNVYTVDSNLSGSEGAAAATYMWEKYTDGRWTDTGITKKTLTMANARPAASGLYRLRASLELNGMPTMVYSPTLAVTAEKRTAVLRAEAAVSGGNLVLTATLENPFPARESGGIPSGALVFEVSHEGGEAVHYTTEVKTNAPQRTGSATVTLPGAADGAYTVTARYGGNTVFQSGISDPAYCLKGSADSYYYLAAPERVYYGETVSPICWKVSQAADGSIVHEQVTTSDYTFKVTSVTRQQITSLNNVATVRFVSDSTGGNHIGSYSNSLALLIMGLDRNNFKRGLDIGVGYDYHYEVKYAVKKGASDSVTEETPVEAELTYRFVVYPRPVTVAAKGGEVQQSRIKALGQDDFTLTSPLGEPLALKDKLMELITPVVKGGTGQSVSWNSTLPLGNYTITIRPNQDAAAKTARYDFSFVPAPIVVTGAKYGLTLTAGPNGTARLTSHSDNSFTAGTNLTFTAAPQTGYEVERWEARVGGQLLHQQSGGARFSVSTLAADLSVHVTFQKKQTALTYGAIPAEDGSVTASTGDSGSQVMEGTSVTLTATPDTGRQVGFWRVYQGNSQVPEQHSGAPGADGSSTLSFPMPGESVYAAAFFEPTSHQINFPKNRVSVRYANGGTVNPGDWVEYGAELVVGGAWQFRVTDWTELPAGVEVEEGAQSFSFTVTGDTSLDAEGVNTRRLKVTQPANGSISVYLGDDSTPTDLDASSGIDIDLGTRVRLAAEPAEGYTPAYWTLGNVASWYGESEIELTMDNYYTISCRFTKTVSEPHIFYPRDDCTCTLEDGTPVAPGEAVAPGTKLIFTAKPPSGKGVRLWVATSPLSYDLQSGGETLEFTMPDFSPSIKVFFGDKTVKVTLDNDTEYGLADLVLPGGVKPDAVPARTSIYLTVDPLKGYVPLVQVDGASFSGGITEAGFYSYTIRVYDTDVAVTVTYQDEREFQIELNKAFLFGGDITASAETAKKGETVELTALPNAGFYHVGWNVVAADQTVVQVTNNQFTMPASNVTVTTMFLQTPGSRDYTVRLNQDGAGDGGTFSAHPTTAKKGQAIALSATPDAGYQLDGWDIETDGGQSVAVTGDTFAMPDDNVTVSARFVRAYAVKLAGGGTAEGGSFSADPLAAAQGQAVALSATPYAGYRLAGWDVETDGGRAVAVAEGSFAMPDDNVTASARFVRVYTVTLAGGGTAGSGSFSADPLAAAEGETVTLSAAPAPGYQFDGWTVTAQGGGAITVSDNAFPMPAENVTVSARFFWPNTGGGGGGGNVTPPKEEDNTVIDQKEGDKLIQDAVDKEQGTIIIDAETPKVSLPSDFLSDAGGKTKADILISTPLASIRLPNGALGSLASLGGEITVQATLEKDKGGQHVLTLDITADGQTIPRVLGGVKVTVPYAAGGVTTVAVLQDGSVVLPKSFAQDGKMTVPLDGPTQALLTDNPKAFHDTANHWGKAYIDFVTSHELFNGVAKNTYDADGTMTRAMLWTVLARMEGADTTAGGAWYEPGMEWAKASGISDGSNPEGPITREQLATMLWRVAGSPEPGAGLGGFSDAGDVSQFAVQPLRWAVEQGIVTGKDGGLLDPKGSATRTEVSAMLMRFICRR